MTLKFDALKTVLVEKLLPIVNGKTCQGVQNDLRRRSTSKREKVHS